MRAYEIYLRNVYSSGDGCIYHIMEAFDLLGWAPILSLPQHIYPDLIRKFYANIINKKGHSGEEIRFFV